MSFMIKVEVCFIEPLNPQIYHIPDFAANIVGVPLPVFLENQVDFKRILTIYVDICGAGVYNLVNLSKYNKIHAPAYNLVFQLRNWQSPNRTAHRVVTNAQFKTASLVFVTVILGAFVLGLSWVGLYSFICIIQIYKTQRQCETSMVILRNVRISVLVAIKTRIILHNLT